MRPNHTIAVRVSLGLLALVFVAACGSAPAPDSGVGGRAEVLTAAARIRAPDVVVIVSDDQRADTLNTMPNVKRLLRNRGVTYRNAMVPTSVCCPSRASILRGMFSHGTKVWGNHLPGGGWVGFRAAGGERSNLATWLDAAGYRTGLFGKYLNQYQRAPAGHVPPRWDRWFAFADKAAFFRYEMVRTDGTIERHGGKARDYSTDVIAAKAGAFIRGTDPTEPLFAMITPFGTHAPFTPAPRHRGTCKSLPRYRPPSYDVAPAHAPGSLARRPPMPASQKRSIDADRIRACETLRSVDDLVATVVNALDRAGRLSNTLVIYASDNGFMWGEHRIYGKGMPYDSATRVPMVARFDGVLGSGVIDRRLALNVDIAATIEDATELVFPRLEGESLLDRSVRRGFVLEGAKGAGRPSYCGWRTAHRIYVNYAEGKSEFYDLGRDRWEMRNRIAAPAARAVIRDMRATAKAACVPSPPGFRW
jgi:arylsulfatase A-like enzyme